MIRCLTIALLCVTACAADFSGSAALEFTRAAVAFGPRPAGSAANLKLQNYIQAQLKPLRCQISFDAFTAETPVGPVKMRNIIATFPGKSGRAVVITGHFDTKATQGEVFVGANDGGASTGVLLELAKVVSSGSFNDDIVLVWLDGEEAFYKWSNIDGTYGSRHLADKWAGTGMIRKIKALINVDMIGDKDLGITQETNSSSWLLRLVWETAQEMGDGRYFLDSEMPMEDDHLPFIARGVKALDLIDFDYGPDNQYWHTPQDTMDKLGAHSLEVVGKVLVKVLGKLQD